MIKFTTTKKVTIKHTNKLMNDGARIPDSFKAVISACVDCVYFGTNFMGVKTFLRGWVLRDKKKGCF